MLKKSIKYTFYGLLGLLVSSVLLVFILFNSTPFQRWLTGYVTNYLSTAFKTEIRIGSIQYYPFTGFELNKIYWGDQKKDTLFYVEQLKFNFGGFNQRQQKLTLNDVKVEGGYCKMITYPDSTFNIDVLFNILDPADTLPSTDTNHFKLYFNRIACNNSRFRLIDSTEVFEPEGFDGFNEDFFNVNLLAKHFWIINDSLHFELKRLSAKERSGFTINDIKSTASISSTGMLFDSLLVLTPYSQLKNSFYISYPTWDDLADYISKAHMYADLKEAKLGMQDIVYFAPFLKGATQQFTITGKGNGTTDNIRFKDIAVQFGSSLFKGSGSIKGLPETAETFLDIRANKVVTNRVDLERILLLDLPVEMNTLGDMQFAGALTGFYNDFVAYGAFETALGKVKSDINMKLGDSTTLPSYSGNINLIDFWMGGLVNSKTIGRTSLTASINGKGFSLNDLESAVDGKINYWVINNYPYHNIELKGNIIHKMFTGNLDMLDPNAELHFAGTVDLNQQIPLYKFKANLAYADLKALQLDTAHLVLSTQVDIDFAIKDLDENKGQIKLDNTLCIRNGVDYPINAVVLKSSQQGNQRTLNLASDFGNANVNGTFSIAQLPSAFTQLAHTLFPNFVAAPKSNIPTQVLTLSFIIEDSKLLYDIGFLPFYAQGSNGKISFNTGDSGISVSANLEQFVYEKYGFQEVAIKQQLEKSNGGAVVTCETFLVNDTAKLKTIELIQAYQQNNIQTQFSIKDTNSLAWGYISLNSLFESNRIANDFDSTSIHYKQKAFSIQPHALIEYVQTTKKWEIENVTLYHLKEKLTINGFYSVTDGVNIKAEASQFQLSIVNTVLSDLKTKIDGNVNGSITIKTSGKNTYLNSYLTLGTLTIDNDTIGNFSFTSNYDETQQRILVYAKSTLGKLKELECGGYIDLSSSPYPVNLSVYFAESDLKSFQAFVKDELTIYYGKVSAKCKITGNVNDLEVNGNLNLMQVLARVEYLKTTYGFNSKITFDQNTATLQPFKLTDVNGKQALVQGNITHQSLSDIKLNIQLTELNGFQVLNTTSRDNSLYYGTAYASGQLAIKGSTSNLVLDAVLKSAKGTKFSIPLSDSDDPDGDQLLNFVNKDTLEKSIDIKGKSSLIGFSMNMLVTITPDADIELVFSEAKDDKIKGNGRGTLKMELNKNGTFSMFGDLNIDDGEYRFTAVDIFTRKFILRKGSTISWTGDPLQARMNIQGVYRVRNTSVADILTSVTPAELEQARLQRTPVDCILNLTGNLLNPTIDFDLNFPDASSNIGSNNFRALENSVRRLRSEPELMQEQVVSLLLFGKFSPQNIAQSANAQGFNNSLNNSLSELISAQAGNIISRIIPGFDVSADFQTGSASSRSQAVITASKRFFNERLEIKGSFDAMDAASNNNIMGQYSLTNDGSIKIRGYNRTSNTNPIYNKNITTQGVGLYYRKEFDRFVDIFQKTKTEIPLPANNSN
ncbi:MAG: translocation/assembly module TamB [Bacteroidia bacterium]|nr:translocation/assembly module TamB [Bacteroidia bacterium]